MHYNKVLQESHTVSPLLWGRGYAAWGIPIGRIEIELGIWHVNFWDLGMDMDCGFCHDWWNINRGRGRRCWSLRIVARLRIEHRLPEYTKCSTN